MVATEKSFIGGLWAKTDLMGEILEGVFSEGGLLVLNNHISKSIFCSDGATLHG